MAFVVLRCIVLYFVASLALRLMGKRQIGELQPNELVITLLFSELASSPLQSPELPLLSGILPICALAAIELLVSGVTLKNLKMRYVFYGKPIILVYGGKPDQKAMEKARISIDDLQEAMRSNEICRIQDIDYAILETNGNMSIIAKNQTDNSGGIPKNIIIDGKFVKEQNDYKKINSVLKKKSIRSYKDVFLMTQDDKGKFHVIVKEK